MTTLMVTPYAPYRDGIAAYAVQEVRRSRAAGIDVEVLSPLPSAAHHHLALGGVRGIAALAKRARRYDTVIIQFSPEMMFGACRTPVQRVLVWTGLVALAKQTRLEIRLHEIEYGPLGRNPAERRVAAMALRSAHRVAVHTAREVEELSARVGIDPGQVTLVDHGQSFAPATALTRAEARAELGLPDDEHVFLAIGFIQEHKGFDRAVDAFGRANLHPLASFHVVGSVRVDHPELLAYARRLEGQCRATPGVTFHQQYVSDEAFDRWIVAADTVVLPYREIWSSVVLERAKLFDRALIASDVGGLADQAPEGSALFSDTEGLVQALTERTQATVTGTTGSAPPPVGERVSHWRFDADAPDRRQIESQIRDRARSRQLGAGHGEGPEGLGGSAVDHLLALGPLPRPHAISARPGVTQVKRLLRRLINLEIEPVATQVDLLQRATVEAIAELERRQRDLDDR
jgi:glycosyltransferase involved in cell wall biosynthesis